MNELYISRCYTPCDAKQYQLPIGSKGFLFNNVDELYDKWKNNELIETEFVDYVPREGFYSTTGKAYKYFYYVDVPETKLIEWDMETCPLREGDSISLIERSSHFIVKEVKTEGIATQEIDLLTWNDLLLYFIQADSSRCGKWIKEFEGRPSTLPLNIFYLGEKTDDPEVFNGRKGYFANRLNRLLLFQGFGSKERYGTLECVDGKYKNLDTGKVYKYFVPEV